MRTVGGREVTGYLFNRSNRSNRLSRDAGRREDGQEGGGAAAFAQLFETATGREITLPYAEIEDVRFSGRPGGRRPRDSGSPGEG